MNTLNSLNKDFNLLKNGETAIKSQRYFKAGNGEYGQGDISLGIKNSRLRILLKKLKKKA